MSKSSLIDLSDDELLQILRAVDKHTVYAFNDYYAELCRRSQEKNTKAMNNWTKIIALSTTIYTLATIILVILSIYAN